jgi:hypothetical protein
LPLTKDHFLLSVDSRLRQKYASKIETETHHRREKTEQLNVKVQEDVHRVLSFDPADIEKKYEEPWNNR